MPHPERTKPIYVPGDGPPQIDRPSPEILEALGAEGVFRMLEDVYEKLEETELRPWFPDDMREASRRSAAFFVQLLGGPSLFSDQFGPPRMRMRHVPFEIDEAARSIWLGSFESVLEQAEERYGFPPEHFTGFRAFLDSFSGWMVNVAPDP